MRATKENPSQRMFEASERGSVSADRLERGLSQTLEAAHPLAEGRGFNIVAGIEFGADDEGREDGMLLLDLRQSQPHAANGKRYPFGVLGPGFETDTPFVLVNRDFDPHKARRLHGFQEIREGETVSVGSGQGDGRFQHPRDIGNLVFDISCANGIVQIRDLYSARGTYDDYKDALRSQRAEREAIDRHYIETIDDEGLRADIARVRERADYLPIELIGNVMSKIATGHREGKEDRLIFRQLSRDYHPNRYQGKHPVFKLVNSLYDTQTKKFRDALSIGMISAN